LIDENQARIILAQLLLAVDLMHRKQIIHRDIKPDNILITDIKDLSVCITDLGMACRLSDEIELRIRCGTPGYVAPEILRERKATTKVDVFSLGSLLFNMFTGLNLFRGATAQEVLSQNKYSNPLNMIN
jgi:serine/threonine protein kinase